MKTIIFLFLSLGCFFSVAAQSTFTQGVSKPTGAYSNAQADTMTYRLAQSYARVSIQPLVTKLTGTMAGTAVLYNSVNGVNYVATGDTFTLTNVTTNTTVWEKISAAKYWMIIVSGGTTLTGTAAAKISASN